MNRIKQALTRKIGPLPAWAWLTGFAVAVYYYRNKISPNASANTANTTTGQVQDASNTGQSIVPLDPGQSAYDPNTGALVTAPGAGDTAGTGTNGSSDIASAIGALTDALVAGENATIPTGTSSTGSKNTGRGKNKGAGKGKSKGSVTKGKTDSGKRKSKTKAGTKATGKAGKTGSGRKRSGIGSGALRGGPLKITQRVASRPRSVVTTAFTAARSRPTTRPVQRTNVTQRPVATHPAAKVPAHTAPKPTQRTRPAPRRKR